MPRVILFIFIFLIAVCLSINMAKAEYCIDVSKRCIDEKVVHHIDGNDVSRPCWEYEYTKECHKDEYTDYCKGIRDVSGCTQISGTCITTEQDGQCSEHVDQFRCGHLLNTVSEIKHLDSEYTIVKDELNTKECVPHEISEECQEISNTCVEGAETRNINGKDIFKDCWKYEKSYSCFVGSSISDCDDYKNKCIFVSQKCLTSNKNGTCKHNENVYECLNVSGKLPKSTNCKSAKYCIGGDCEEVKYEPNKNMGRAISGLSLLSNLRKELNQEECASGAANCNVFRGNSNSCKFNMLNARNCCKDKGWAKDLGLLECKPEELALSVKKERGLCHYVEQYCSHKKWGICYEKKRSYCCFDSKLARIVQEQGHKQLGIGWGDGKHPNCSPLTIEQLQKIDFNRVDLREIYGEVLSKFNINKHNDIKEQTKQTVDVKAESAASHADSSQKTEQIKNTSKEQRDEITRRLKRHYGQ